MRNFFWWLSRIYLILIFPYILLGAFFNPFSDPYLIAKWATFNLLFIFATPVLILLAAIVFNYTTAVVTRAVKIWNWLAVILAVLLSLPLLLAFFISNAPGAGDGMLAFIPVYFIGGPLLIVSVIGLLVSERMGTSKL